MKQKIQKHHEFSFKGVIQIIKFRKTFFKKEYIYCYVFSLAFTIYLGFHSEFIFKIIKELTKANLSVFPCLCGFSISGLAITIGFADKEIIKQSVSVNEYNIYQQGIAIMAINVILQLICLSAAYIITFVCNSGLNDIFTVPQYFAGIINLGIVLLLTALTSVSIVMVFYVVFNLFTFGQLNSLYNTIQKFKQIKNGNSNN